MSPTLLDQARQKRRAKLLQVADEYRQSMRARGRTPRPVQITETGVRIYKNPNQPV